MNLHRAIKEAERSINFFARVTAEVPEGQRDMKWHRRKKDQVMLETLVDALVGNDPMPDASDLRAFRKMESNTI